MAPSFDALIDALAASARADRDAWSRDGWARASSAVAPQASEFLEWARRHRRWSFIVAEAADEVCAKPPEAAAWVLHQIVEELLETT
jgi:hypothetical protein